MGKNISLHLRVPKQSLEEIYQRYHVRRLALFGSALCHDFGAESGVDILVELALGHTPGFGFARLQRELSTLFSRPVDLPTYGSLSRYFLDQVAQEAEIQYERRTEV